MNWFSTFRTRTGVASNDTLVYVTGGLALAKIDNTYFTDHSDDGDGIVSAAQDKTRLGWTGGIGAEFAVAPGWSVNAEALYMQFRKETVTLPSPISGQAAATFDNYDSAWVGRVGLNYRWGGAGIGPLVAKN